MFIVFFSSCANVLDYNFSYKTCRQYGLDRSAHRIQRIWCTSIDIHTKKNYTNDRWIDCNCQVSNQVSYASLVLYCSFNCVDLVRAHDMHIQSYLSKWLYSNRMIVHEVNRKRIDTERKKSQVGHTLPTDQCSVNCILKDWDRWSLLVCGHIFDEMENMYWFTDCLWRFWVPFFSVFSLFKRFAATFFFASFATREMPLWRIWDWAEM